VFKYAWEALALVQTTLSSIGIRMDEGEVLAPSTADTIVPVFLDRKNSLESEQPKEESWRSKVARRIMFWKSAPNSDKQSANLHSFRKLIAMEFRGSPFILSFGLLAAILEGAVLPSFAIIFGKNFNLFTEGASAIQSTTWKYSLAFFALGVGVNILAYIRVSTFGVASEKLAKNLRTAAFSSLVKQVTTRFSSIEYIAHPFSGSFVLRCPEIRRIGE
jgi:hypothetical protein